MKRKFEVPAVRTKDQLFAEKLRNKIKIDIEDAAAYQFKIADKKEELECASRLVHDKYVRKGYMTPTESGLRLSLRNALPETTTFIGVKNQVVASTLTLFQDSEMGLPMDAIYKPELDQLRSQGRKIAEVGSLASHICVAKSDQTVLMHGNKIMHSYSRDYLGVDDLVVAINPKHQWFYQHILLFEQIGELKAYDYVKKAPAVAYRLNLNMAEYHYKAAYEDKPPEKNLYRFFYVDKSPSIRFPAENQCLCFWNKERIKYFFEEKTCLLAEADKEAIECLEKKYKNLEKTYYMKLPEPPAYPATAADLLYPDFHRLNYLPAA
ncbi:MAG: hypothetical protein RBT11_16570 [Desulfobacterales bacterium]|jgi:hypothetical protein|nr:hypothetical protein [Desulfobacterales bacterium]